MVATIDQAFISQFSSNIHDLLEQKGSKLLPYVDVVSVNGEKAFFERLGSLTISEVTSRHADTVIQDALHSRRMLTTKDYAGAVMLDHQDEIRMLIDPSNNYAKKLANEMGRKIDDVIIAALYGTAATGSDGTGSASFDTTNQEIASGSAKLTIEKLIQAKKIFMSNEYDGPLTCIVGADGIEDLLTETEVQSADYNSIRALVRGEIDTFMGFKFIVNNRIPAVGADKQALIFAPEALKFGRNDNMMVKMSERADKNHNKQVFIRHTFGAVRMEEELVVSVLYQ